LDNIQDPGNVGTIIRNAVAFNIDTVVLSEDCVDLYNEKVLRSAQGMNFHINIITENLTEFIIKLKTENYYIYGTDLLSNNELSEIKPKDKFAIILGNEGNGVKKELLDLCDKKLYIEMNNNCESLNVGVASGIILYKFSK
jgi:TrmH family RNA methyltransferase